MILSLSLITSLSLNPASLILNSFTRLTINLSHNYYTFSVPHPAYLLIPLHIIEIKKMFHMKHCIPLIIFTCLYKPFFHPHQTQTKLKISPPPLAPIILYFKKQRNLSHHYKD